MDEIKLRDMIGEVVSIALMDTEGKMSKVKLLGLESHGLWLESQELTNELLEKMNIPASEKTIVLFVPFHRIRFLFYPMKATSLQEKAFGV